MLLLSEVVVHLSITSSTSSLLNKAFEFQETEQPKADIPLVQHMWNKSGSNAYWLFRRFVRGAVD